MRIGIFGGSFNPPHKMHLDMALELINNNYLDKVIFVPTSNYYPKEGLVSDKHRYNMISIMIKDYKNLSISDYEFGKLTYTYQTLTHFQNEYPTDEVYFICGSDNLKMIDTWREYKTILTKFHILVIPREKNIDYLIKRFDVYKKNIEIANIKFSTLSSTEIRKILKNESAKSNIGEKIDLKVLNYIKNNKLY